MRGLLVAGMFSTFFLGALYLERVRGYSALGTGVAFLPLSLAVGVLSARHHRAPDGPLRPPRRDAAGLVLSCVALLLMSRVGEHSTYFPACSSRS